MNYFSSLKYIKAIEEARSISAAADSLNISQPALSSHLKKLENALGVLLFDRTKQPLELTDAGKVYLDYGEKYQALNKEFLQHMTDIETLKTGHLTIGGAASFNVSYLPKTVAEFTKLYPGIEIEIIDGNIPEITSKALSGQIDIFIAPTLNYDSRLKFEELLTENIFLCIPSRWEINKELADNEIGLDEIISGKYVKELGKRSIDFNRLADCTFITLKKSQHIGDTLRRLFKEHGFESQKTVMVEQTMTSYSLTLAGVGISLMTESTIRNSNFKEMPKFYITDPQICRRKIYAMYSAQKYFPKAAKAFMSILKKNLK